MNVYATRCGSVLYGSETQTSHDYRPSARYQQLVLPPPPGFNEARVNQLARLLTLTSQQRLARLRTFQSGWDGYGSEAPRLEAIANAEARLPELYRLATVDGVWREPHISASEDGEITFEWWSDDRKVTMYFGADRLEIIRVWGSNIDSEMDLQPVPTLDGFPAVWAWLYGN